ncbi:MAG: hypothetical protein HGB02_08735 [Chlorobiaceae bacterium]|nr:hypothetical protein [Chlorobiaceae bacterium]
MIHYHGTPCGGVSADLPRFYQARHALVSFARPDDIAVAAECCQSFCLDNGAFSAWKRGHTPDWDEYLEWVSEWASHPGFDFWIIPDDIEGDERANWKLMFKYGLRVRHAMPVYHMHESLDHLERVIKEFPRIAIGSSGQWPNPGTASWWTRMEQIMEVCCINGKPRVKLHGLRMLDPEIFGRLPLASADSTNAVMNSKSNTRFGMYKPPTAAQSACIIADRIECHNSAATWKPSTQMQLWT